MIEALAHRGPDDRGFWTMDPGHDSIHLNSRAVLPGGGSTAGALMLNKHVERPIDQRGYPALLHTRLAVLDLSPAGHQPMVDPQTGNRIVYNGEVYNFREIRRDLEARGVCFHSDCDTEVLLHAYAVWGAACVRKFRGMFAFALWDEKARHLFLARDRLGIKPLYYFHSGGEFLFASEVRALLASGRVPRAISPEGLASYLAFGSVTEPCAMVAGVRMLPPGHTAVFDGRRLTLECYWGLDGRGWQVKPPPSARALEAVRDRLDEAVELRLISDAPIGAFLSGGIDSSAVVSLMANHAPGRVRTVSLCFEESAFDESVHSHAIAQQFGTDHHSIVISAAEVLDHLDAALSALDQPSLDGLNTWFVSRAARQAGLTVALSGLGGDELFAGYSSFRSAPGLERLRQFAAPMPASIRAAAGSGARWALSRRGAGAGAQKLADLLAFAPDIAHAVLMQRALFGPRQLAELLGQPLSEAVPDVYRVSGELLGRGHPPIRQVSLIECGHYMRNTLLRDTDAMSMSHALEVRVPLIDHLLVELVLGIEDRLKMDPSTPKPLLVHAIGDRLPRTAVHRAKRGFTFPFEVWLRGPLGKRVRSALCSPRSAIAQVLEPQALSGVWRDFENGRMSWSRPWSLFALNTWMEACLG